MKYKIGYLGEWEEVPDPIAVVYDRDFQGLERLMANGLDINQKIKISHGIFLYPIEVAVYQNDKEMLETLLKYGANLDYSSLDTAIRCADPEIAEMFVYQIKNLREDEKFRLFCSIGWGNRLENLQVLEKAGLKVSEYGGEAFRDIVFSREPFLEYFDLLLKKNVDINFCKADSVFVEGKTPVAVAASRNNFDLVKRLVELGADITICDQYGERPYTHALRVNNIEMAEYLKALEPVEWHLEKEREMALKPYRLPKEMVEYLKTQPLLVEFPEYKDVKWLKFFSYMELREIKWKRRKYLSIVQEIHNYGSNCKILWNGKDKKMFGFDIEHEEIEELCGWNEFIADPGKWLNGYIRGELDG